MKKEQTMKLQDFITETIVNVVNGVKNAQEQTKDTGCFICPKNLTNKNELSGHRGEHVSLIDFTVVLQSTTDSENQSGIGVWLGGISVGIKGKDNANSLIGTTIKFDVPVQLPTSDNQS